MDSPSPGSVRKPFTERHWRNLLTDIHDGQVGVIVGPELAIGPDEAGRATLYEYLARDVTRRLGVEADRLGPRATLLDVCNVYLQQPESEADDLHREVREALRNLQWPVPEPLQDLAAVGDLKLFITTTVDSLLENALNQVRFAGQRQTRVLSYSEKSQIQDVAGDFESRPEATVFHLFGRLNASGDYALTEEKILEYGHRLQSRDLRPPNLFDLLKNRHLLVLGCSLPGWLARFTLRASKGDPLLTQGARGSLIADRDSRGDRDFAMFLERRKVWLYEEGDAVQFVGELRQRWTTLYADQRPAPTGDAGGDETPAEFKTDSVFLSYAHEDHHIAVEVASALDAAGVDVWFDKRRLEAGDNFRLVIEKNIEHCSYFVPLISQNTARLEKRFFQREWHKAIDEAKEWPEGYPFIQPIVVDDVDITAPGVPEAFRHYHARRLGDLPAFIEDARKRIRERRAMRRAG
ncbi:MAG TPA: toll/interleukin-1 receptor domain-containing protein [Vicinamibacterales bacterium]|nr:toll/interleukin-1 receptor domain-containing protein [Vicinamibacterales bacterium]